MMKKLLAIMVAMATIAAIAPLAGADDPTITITISPSGTASIAVRNPATGVTIDAWNGGGATIGGIEVLTSGTYNWASVNSTGNVPVDVSVSVADSVGWTAETGAGVDQFMLNYYLTSSPVNIDTDGVVFATGMAYNGHQLFDLGIQLPTSSTTTAEQSIVVTFTATAAA